MATQPYTAPAAVVAPVFPEVARFGPEIALPAPLQHLAALELAFLPAASASPVHALTEALGAIERDQLGRAIEVLIAMLDVADGDLDRELNGDEGDSFRGEDDFCDFSQSSPYPGCPISDPAEDDDYASSTPGWCGSAYAI